MPKGILIVHSQASHPDRDVEYNDWYDATHIPQVCDVPGVVRATRYEAAVSAAMPSPEGATRYVAVYELDADDLDAVLQQIVDRVGDGRIEMSDAMEMDPVPSTLLYTLRD